jgi:arsenite methyltransferase
MSGRSADEEIREQVRQRYAAAAKDVASGGRATPCGAADGLIGATNYAPDDARTVPSAALAASLGCGNPTLLAELSEGQIVLDLGSGGGIDVLLSARRVGPTGRAYGLDMTAEMLELARTNQREAGVENAEFLEGTIEAVPLADGAVDVIISNCVVNLSPDKPAVLRESFRVLRHGGRMAISDIVLARPLSPELLGLMGLWTGCVAGALTDAEYRRILDEAGFVDVEVVPTNVYDRPALIAMAGEMIDVEQLDVDVDTVLSELDGAVMSAFVRARKP